MKRAIGSWRPGYHALVRKFIALHFGDAGGITGLFPYMKRDFKWRDDSVTPIDARTILKNNIEYHGLERHARQYHTTAQYEYAYHHWLIAATWRRETMEANLFEDERHQAAVEFDLRNAEYNKALDRWQKHRRKGMPTPEEFGLDPEKVERMVRTAQAEIDAVYAEISSEVEE